MFPGQKYFLAVNDWVFREAKMSTHPMFKTVI